MNAPLEFELAKVIHTQRLQQAANRRLLKTIQVAQPQVEQSLFHSLRNLFNLRMPVVRRQNNAPRPA